MIATIRFLIYRALLHLARSFMDRQIKRHAEAIFAQLDPKIPSLVQIGSAPVMEQVAVRAIKTATGLASVDQRQVDQLLDLFNPVAALRRDTP